MNPIARPVSSVQTAVSGNRWAAEARLPVLAVLALGILLFLGVGLFHVWSRVALLDKGYELSAQKNRREELLQERKTLLLEIARLRDPARLERAAKSLGLAKPEPGQVIIMKDVR